MDEVWIAETGEDGYSLSLHGVFSSREKALGSVRSVLGAQAWGGGWIIYPMVLDDPDAPRTGRWGGRKEEGEEWGHEGEKVRSPNPRP